MSFKGTVMKSFAHQYGNGMVENVESIQEGNQSEKNKLIFPENNNIN
ncbi:hypothetical protein [Brevibacillus invocatus]